MQQMVDHVGRLPSKGEFRPPGTLSAMLLDLEVAAARSVGALSRLARRGGGTTLPGQAALEASTPGRRPARRAARPAGRCSSPRRTARRRRPRWPPRSSARQARLQPLGREPALRRRVHPALVARRRARPVRGRRGARCRRSRAASVRGWSRSATSFATSSTATASSSTWPSAGARASASLPETLLVVNADDPLLGELARGRDNATTYGLDDPRHARASLQHAADSKYCLVCGAAVRVRRRIRRAISATTAARAAAPRGCRSTSRPGRSSCTGSTGPAFTLVTPVGQRAGASSRCPGSTTSTTPPLPRRSPALLGVPLDAIAGGPGAVHGRVRPLRADRGRRPAHPAPADQEPRRRERGGADAARRLSPTPRCGRAQRRDRRRPRRLVDLGRRLRAAARRARPGRRRRATARPSSRSASPTAASTAAGSRSSPPSRRRSIAGSS